MGLPKRFEDSMKELLGSEYDDFIRSYEDKSISAIRINTSKISTQDFEKLISFEIRTDIPDIESCVDFPPGAAQRSSTISPGSQGRIDAGSIADASWI